MGDGLSLDIGMNTREVIKGAGDIGEALEGVSDSLDQVAQDGDDSIEDLEHAFSDAMRGMVDESRRSGGDIGDNLSEGAQAAAESTEGIGESADGAHVSLGRLTSGGKRLLQGDLGGAAEFVANKLTALGPAGAVAGAVAALGVGLVTTALNEQQGRVDELKGKISDLYKQAAKDGRAYVEQAAIDANVLEILYGSPEEKDRLKQEAERIGVDFLTLVQAQAGEYDALTYAITKARDAEQERQRVAASRPGAYDQVLASDETLFAIQQQLGRLEQLRQAHEDNSAAANQYSEYVQAAAQSERDQIKKTRDADSARYEALAASQRKAANPPKIVQQVEVDTAAADRSLAAWRRQFTAGSKRLTIVADVVDRSGKRIV